MMDKILCNKRIRILLETQQELTSNLSGMVPEAFSDSYTELENIFQKLVEKEAKYLIEL